MNLSRSGVTILRELVKRSQLRGALESGFETVPGDRQLCVRRQDVVDHVASALGIRVINNRLFADVARAASELGWEPIRNGGRSLFRCVKRKDQDLDEALTVSRANRHDPRTGLGAGIPGDDPASVAG